MVQQPDDYKATGKSDEIFSPSAALQGGGLQEAKHNKKQKKWRQKFEGFEKVKSGDLWDFEVSGGSGQHGSLYEVSFFVQQVTEFAWI